MHNIPCNPLEIAESLANYWSPKVISEVDDSYVKVAKLKDNFVWHAHQDEDELFLILKGALTIEYQDKKIHLQQGDMHVVPKGALHNPIAEDECLVMLIEKKNTLHTGNTQHCSSRSVEEQLAGYSHLNSSHSNQENV